jgi:hypothetical protein
MSPTEKKKEGKNDRRFNDWSKPYEQTFQMLDKEKRPSHSIRRMPSVLDRRPRTCRGLVHPASGLSGFVVSSLQRIKHRQADNHGECRSVVGERAAPIEHMCCGPLGRLLNGAIAPSGNYCKFSFPGSKKKIRAAARLFDSNTGELIGVIAAQ